MGKDDVGGCRGRQLALVVLLALVSACGPEGHAIDPPAVAAPFPLLGSASDFYVDEDNPAAVWARSAPPGPEADLIREQIASRPAAQIVRAPDQVKKAGIGEAPALVVIRVDEGCPTGAAMILGALARTTVLLDVSDSPSPADAAEKIAAAGQDVDGFAVNVRGYADETTATATASAIRHRLLAATGRNDYFMVADSSRGGAPTTGDCNPADARVGQNQVLRPERDKLQLLWLTTPGISDGPCGEAPASRAGEFVPALAYALAKRPDLGRVREGLSRACPDPQ
ncbi:hypothetical protein [Amycolatopsis sp. NPDC052450]|uniref:hypothetical protein n=1 Tax=Amycolatopsis sp. NPDC052450 TaxID=3363937 RepID=UPI0037CCA988